MVGYPLRGCESEELLTNTGIVVVAKFGSNNISFHADRNSTKSCKFLVSWGFDLSRSQEAGEDKRSKANQCGKS